jgi:hypothetical protein
MNTILAINLGKFNNILCWYALDMRDDVFHSATTTPEVLRAELLGCHGLWYSTNHVHRDPGTILNGKM